MELIRVRAKLTEGKIGFIGDDGGLPHKRRKNGDVFRIPENLFSEKWMEKIDEPKKVGRPRKAEPEEKEAFDE